MKELSFNGIFIWIFDFGFLCFLILNFFNIVKWFFMLIFVNDFSILLFLIFLRNFLNFLFMVILFVGLLVVGINFFNVLLLVCL